MSTPSSVVARRVLGIGSGGGGGDGGGHRFPIVRFVLCQVHEHLQTLKNCSSVPGEVRQDFKCWTTFTCDML